ncbi:MAG: hypothetical protein KDA85_06760 [Planctomycetaceae bacterium]|nr:hypothetical protein [Planctomycetaceae bacterium]
MESNSSLGYLLHRQGRHLNDRLRDELSLAIDEALCDTEILSAQWFR